MRTFIIMRLICAINSCTYILSQLYPPPPPEIQKSFLYKLASTIITITVSSSFTLTQRWLQLLLLLPPPPSPNQDRNSRWRNMVNNTMHMILVFKRTEIKENKENEKARIYKKEKRKEKKEHTTKLIMNYLE